MYKAVFILLLVLLLKPLGAQNLVPNPSFEDTVQCPYTASQIYLAAPWTQSTIGTADLYHTCADVATQISVPLNQMGYQYARTGNAYAGIFTFADDFSSDNDYREYLQVELKESLIGGKRYCVSFFASLADTLFLTSSTVGAYFSSDPISSPTYYPLLYKPQVENSQDVFFNYSDWTQVEDVFYATGNERYINIGNFYSTDETIWKLADSSALPQGPVYLFIDDVSVEECDVELPNIFTPNNDGVNDVLMFEGFGGAEQFTCIIYNRWGNQIYSGHDPLRAWEGKSMNDDPVVDGVYYYVIKAEYPNGFELNKTGFVHLVR